MDSSFKLQGNWNTKIVLDERAIQSNRLSALLCISNSSVELDGLQLDASNNHPHTPHHPYSSGYAGQSISVLSICSSFIVVSNSKIRVPPQQSPFVITDSDTSGGDETTHICVRNSSLFSSSSICGAATLILPTTRHLCLCVSMMSCSIDSTQIGSDTGLLVHVAHSPRSNRNCGRIETLLSGNRFENVTRTSSGHFSSSDHGVWSQRLISNSITNGTSVLCGSVIRDMNLGGNFLSTNTSFVSCSTSSVQPIPRRELEFNIFRPYLGQNLRQDKSVDGAYEWEEENFGKGTLFDFFDYNSKNRNHFDEGSRFLFSSFSHTIRFTNCTFTNIDGKDEDDKYRRYDGAAIIIRCPSSLVVDKCHFSNCGGGMEGGAIDIICPKEQTTASIFSTMFIECWTTSESSSVLHHDSLGIVTLRACNFLNFDVTREHSQIVYSEGIIVSDCLFNFNGSKFSRALCVYGAVNQFLFTSFFSDDQARNDVSFSDSSYSLQLFVECVSNSRQAQALFFIGFSPVDMEQAVWEVAVDPDSFQTALTDTNINLFYLGGGNYGAFEIDSHDFTMSQWNKPDDLNPSAPVFISFSMTVKAGTTILITVSQIVPLNESSSLVSTQGTCSLQSVVIDQIDGRTVPLLTASGSDASLSLFNDRITNIRNATANLIEVTNHASVFLDTMFIMQISSTQSVVSIQDCAHVHMYLTMIAHVHRTEGEGPAAVDISKADEIYMDELTIRDCVSDEGNVGGIHLITTPEASNSIYITCLSNAAAPGTPTHVLVEGLDEEQTHVLLAGCRLFGADPHFGWKNGANSGTGFGRVDVSDITFTLATSTVLQHSHDLTIEAIHLSEFHLDEIYAHLPAGPQVEVTCHLPFDAPLVQKPVTFTAHHFQLKSQLWVGSFPNALLLQDEATLEESLFTIQTNSEVDVRSLAIRLDSQISSPLVKVDVSSTFILEEGVVFGGAGRFHRPFLETSGSVKLEFCHFYGLSFNDHSCIEMSGGTIILEGETDPTKVSSVVNVSTTGKGAFLSSSNSERITIDHVFFVNCSAEAGGAIFLENAEELDISSSFDTCIASTGGAMMIVDSTGSGGFDITSSFINCRAQRGGGLFFSLAEGSSVWIGGMERIEMFERYYSHAAFKNCLAEQGAGIYVEGTMKGDQFDCYSAGFNNWNAEGLGTDIFFAKGTHFDDLSSKIESWKEYVHSTSRQSTDLSKQCQMYFESSPSDSFDFSLTVFKLSGSGTDVASPLTASELNSFREITPYLHVMDDRGKMMNVTVIVGDKFYIFERGLCSSQHLSFSHAADTPDDSPVKIKRDDESPLYDLVALELGSDAVIEFHNLIFEVECAFQMMLVKHRSARGLIETCQFLFEAGMELPLALFEVEDGTLSLTQTLISVKGEEGSLGENNFVLTAAPLILVAPADSAASSPNVLLDHATLRRMQLKSDVVSLMLLDFSASVEVNEVEFIECNQSSSQEAQRIVATGSNLEDVVDTWKGFETLVDPADPLNWAINNAESAESIWHTVPLRVAFIRFEGQLIKVEKTGKDVAGCGEGSWNCRGLVRAGKNVGGDQPCTITVVESSFLNGVFDPPAKRTTVESSSSKSVIVVEKEGRMVNSPDGGQAPILTLSHHSFSLPPALNADSLIQSLGGEVTVKNCWFVSSSPISFHLLSATSGVVDIDSVVMSELKYSCTLIKLVGLDSASIQSLILSDLAEFPLVSAEGQPSKKWRLTIKQSTFEGPSFSPNETPPDSEKLCSWESGLVVLKECVCDISWTKFRDIRQGAIHATNSTVTLSQSDLTHNGLPSSAFPSAQQNIRCVGTGKILIESSSTGSTLAETDLWVSGDDECVVDGENISPRHTFFEPSLTTSNCSSEFVKKEDVYEVEIVGTKLVPCGLWLEVFEDDSSSGNAVKNEVIDISELATTWKHPSLSHSPPLASPPSQTHLAG